MLSTSFRQTVITLCGLTLIAACDTDRAVSPTSASKPASVPTTAAGAVLPTPTAYIATETVDQNGAFTGGAVLVLKDSTKTPIALIADDGPLDVNKQPGKLAFALPRAGTFTVCEGNAPAGYGYAPNQPPCFTVTVKWGTTVHYTGFLLFPAPSVVFFTEDYWGNPLGPSTFTISWARGLGHIAVTDNGQNDLLPNKLGSMLVKLPAAGMYTLCETVAPFGYYKATPSCVSVDATSGGAVAVQTFLHPEAQVFKP